MYYDPGDNNNNNREQSGCNVPNSVCNIMPFSQIFNDPQSLSQPSCDEWPMAVSTLPVMQIQVRILTVRPHQETKQQDYNQRSPNSLRCIETGDNGSKSLLPTMT